MALMYLSQHRSKAIGIMWTEKGGLQSSFRLSVMTSACEYCIHNFEASSSGIVFFQECTCVFNILPGVCVWGGGHFGHPVWFFASTRRHIWHNYWCRYINSAPCVKFSGQFWNNGTQPEAQSDTRNLMRKSSIILLSNIWHDSERHHREIDIFAILLVPTIMNAGGCTIEWTKKHFWKLIWDRAWNGSLKRCKFKSTNFYELTSN